MQSDLRYKYFLARASTSQFIQGDRELRLSSPQNHLVGSANPFVLGIRMQLPSNSVARSWKDKGR